MKNKKLIVTLSLCMLTLSACSVNAANDKPVLRNVFKDYFLIGGAYNTRVVNGQDPNAAAIAAKHFSTATSENDMKWQLIHPQPDTYNWGPADQFIEFCQKNNQAPIGHCLVWHSQVPGWVFQGTATETSDAPAQNAAEATPPAVGRRGRGGFGGFGRGGFSGPPATREELLERMKDHITNVVGRYKGKVKGYDVVNEALNDNGTLRNTQWLRIIGEGKEEQQYDHIIKAFEFAHAADPDAELYYNDYNIDTSRRKADGAVEIVKQLKAKGLRIDGVGIQCHAGLGYPNPEDLEYAINVIKEAGVKVMITELDIRTATRGYRGADVSMVNRGSTSDPTAAAEETQKRLADKYAELFKVFVKHKDAVTRVTFWGVYDATSWIGGSPLLFDRNYQPKLCFDAVVETVSK